MTTKHWIRRALALTAFLPAAVPAADSARVDTALEQLKSAVAIRSVSGSDQVVVYANQLRETLVGAGFATSEVVVEPMRRGASHSALLTATWPGRDRGKKPLVLIGHMDVVPARREDWKRDPFIATAEDGFLYGRGVKDNKFDVTMQVATLAALRRGGWKPGRDIVLALTGDEEAGGADARVLADRLRNAELVLNGDSGGGRLAEDGSGPVTYTIQAGEKTYANMTLTVTDPGGHSARPTQTNAIARLSRALVRLDAYRFPLMRTELTTSFFAASAPVTPGERGDWMRRYAADANDVAAIDGLRTQPDLVGMLGTTCVATQVSAGHAPNALPQRAVANVNCRIFPGTSAEAVRKTLVEVVADPDVNVTFDAGTVYESPASPLRADVIAAVGKAVHAQFPRVRVIPAMYPSATDGRYFRAVGLPTYAVSGLYIKASDDFAHGLDERVPLDSIGPALAHWESLLRTLGR